MNRKLMIIGASGHGKVVVDIAQKMNRWESIMFLDKSFDIAECLGYQVALDDGTYEQYIGEYDFFVAIGNNIIREKILTHLEELNASIATLIHPNAVISSDVRINYGTVIMGGVVINPSTSIGKGCIINTSSSIDHDNRIEDYVHISPGAHLAGNVKIGKRCWLGIGSIVSNNINICSDCMFGAGAVVTKNIVEQGMYIGIPAKIKKENLRE